MAPREHHETAEVSQEQPDSERSAMDVDKLVLKEKLTQMQQFKHDAKRKEGYQGHPW